MGLLRLICIICMQYQELRMAMRLAIVLLKPKQRALNVLHEGVKFGCAECANALAIEFGHPFDLANMLAPYVDKARGERYGVLNRALGFNPNRRFPNLDKILPLPPADLPPWDGQRKSLLDAAMGVRPPPAIPQPGTASLFKRAVFPGRRLCAAAHRLAQRRADRAIFRILATGRFAVPASPALFTRHRLPHWLCHV